MAAPEPRAKNLADLYDLASLDWADVRRTPEEDHLRSVEGRPNDGGQIVDLGLHGFEFVAGAGFEPATFRL
jgi:hypothetical protein